MNTPLTEAEKAEFLKHFASKEYQSLRDGWVRRWARSGLDPQDIAQEIALAHLTPRGRVIGSFSRKVSRPLRWLVKSHNGARSYAAYAQRTVYVGGQNGEDDMLRNTRLDVTRQPWAAPGRLPRQEAAKLWALVRKHTKGNARRALWLYYGRGCRTKEVAEKLGITLAQAVNFRTSGIQSIRNGVNGRTTKGFLRQQVTLFGETQTIRDWLVYLGVSEHSVRSRYRRGASLEEALLGALDTKRRKAS